MQGCAGEGKGGKQHQKGSQRQTMMSKLPSLTTSVTLKLPTCISMDHIISRPGFILTLHGRCLHSLMEPQEPGLELVPTSLLPLKLEVDEFLPSLCPRRFSLNCESGNGSRKQYHQPPSRPEDLPSAHLSKFSGRHLPRLLPVSITRKVPACISPLLLSIF